MFELDRNWSRFVGSPEDIAAASQIIVDTFEAATNFGMETSVVVEFAGGLTHKSDDLSPLTDLTAAQLQEVRLIQVGVDHDWNAVSEAQVEARMADAPVPVRPGCSAALRFTTTGTTLRIHGDDRASVVGLAGHVADRLGLRAQGSLLPPGAAEGLKAGASLVLPVVLGSVGLAVGEVVGGGAGNGRWDGSEIIGLVAGFALGLAASVSVWMIGRQLELIPPGGQSRARRWRGRIIGAVAALVIGLLGSALYDALS